MIMYVVTHASDSASAGGSATACRPRAKNHSAAHTRTTAAAAFERIVKKLKKFAAVVATSLPSSAAVPIDFASCAMIAAAIIAATARRMTDQVRAHAFVRMPLTISAVGGGAPIGWGVT